MTPTKFLKGDYVLVQIQGKDMWVGKVEAVESSCYMIKDIYSEAPFRTRLPFLYDDHLIKIEESDIPKVLQTVKVLFKR